MVIEFKAWHLEKLKLEDDVRKMVTAKMAVLEGLSKASLAGTVVGMSGSTVVLLGIVGAVPMDAENGCCEVFIVSDLDRARYAVEFVKSVKDVLRYARQRFARIQALGEDTPFFNRWFTWLGFVCEKTLADGKLMWGMSGAARA